MHHARIVRDKAVKRHLIQVATEIVEVGYEESEAAERLLDIAESKIFDISKEKSRTRFARLHDEMPGTFDYVEAIMNRGGELTGLPTGFRDVDEITGGLQPGELIIIASRPSMGKTALALNIARNAALDHGKKVAVFSLEMTTRSLILRLLASEAEIDFSTLRKGFLANSAYRRLTEAGDRLSRAEIWIDDSGIATILEIKAKCRRLKAERGLDLVMVDYLQLASADGRRDRKDLEIAEISRGLKALAKELQLPVVALSQLNRGPEQRDPDKRRPILGDLRESGAIEQDADVIAFIYRDVIYNKETEDPKLAELEIAKQRNGPTGTAEAPLRGALCALRESNRSTRRSSAAGRRLRRSPARRDSTGMTPRMAAPSTTSPRSRCRLFAKPDPSLPAPPSASRLPPSRWTRRASRRAKPSSGRPASTPYAGKISPIAAVTWRATIAGGSAS